MSTSINFWRLLERCLRPSFELLLSLFDTFHAGGPAGIWERPSEAKPCGVAVMFLQSDRATRNVYGMALAVTLFLTQTATHSALSVDFTSPGALAFVLGVDLAAGCQEQYSETTEFNLSHVMLTCWIISHVFLGSGRPGKKFDASAFTVGSSFAAWRDWFRKSFLEEHC